jgi:hypothetical protein
MSRSGYSDDCDGWALIRWRGAVASAIKGQRGQAFLRKVLVALDAMPDKRLAADSLHEPSSGEFCTLGVVGTARGLDLAALEYSEREDVADAFGISSALAGEIMFMNDDNELTDDCTTPEQRWVRMRKWISGKIQTGDKS